MGLTAEVMGSQAEQGPNETFAWMPAATDVPSERKAAYTCEPGLTYGVIVLTDVRRIHSGSADDVPLYRENVSKYGSIENRVTVKYTHWPG